LRSPKHRKDDALEGAERVFRQLGKEKLGDKMGLEEKIMEEVRKRFPL
jgi:hypothetical protein